jgi:hypothetical protein
VDALYLLQEPTPHLYVRRKLLCLQPALLLLPLHEKPLERVLRRGQGARDAEILARLVSLDPRADVPATTPLCLQEIPLPLRPMHVELAPTR